MHIDFDISLDKKSCKTYKNIYIYDISCKTFMDEKQLCIRFSEIDGFIKTHDGIRYLHYLALNDIMQTIIGLDIL